MARYKLEAENLEEALVAISGMLVEQRTQMQAVTTILVSLLAKSENISEDEAQQIVRSILEDNLSRAGDRYNEMINEYRIAKIKSSD